MSKREIDEIPRKVETKDFSEIRDEELINVIGGKMRTKEVIEIIKKTLTKCFIPCGMRFRHYADTKETIFTSPELCIKLIEEPNNNYYTIEYDICFHLYNEVIETLLIIKKPCIFKYANQFRTLNYVCLPLKYGAMQCE